MPSDEPRAAGAASPDDRQPHGGTAVPPAPPPPLGGGEDGISSSPAGGAAAITSTPPSPRLGEAMEEAVLSEDTEKEHLPPALDPLDNQVHPNEPLADPSDSSAPGASSPTPGGVRKQQQPHPLAARPASPGSDGAAARQRGGSPTSPDGGAPALNPRHSQASLPRGGGGGAMRVAGSGSSHGGSVRFSRSSLRGPQQQQQQWQQHRHHSPVRGSPSQGSPQFCSPMSSVAEESHQQHAQSERSSLRDRGGAQQQQAGVTSSISTRGGGTGGDELDRSSRRVTTDGETSIAHIDTVENAPPPVSHRLDAMQVGIAVTLMLGHALFHLVGSAVPQGMRVRLTPPIGFTSSESLEEAGAHIILIASSVASGCSVAVCATLAALYSRQDPGVLHSAVLIQATRAFLVVFVIAVVASLVGMCIIYRALWDLELYRIYRHDVTPLEAFKLETCGRVAGFALIAAASCVCVLRVVRTPRTRETPRELMRIPKWDLAGLGGLAVSCFIYSLLASCVPSCMRVDLGPELPEELKEQDFRSPTFAHQTEHVLVSLGSALVVVTTLVLVFVVRSLLKRPLSIAHKNWTVILVLFLFIGMVLEVAGKGLLLADLRGNELVGNRVAEVADAFRIEKVGYLLGPFAFYAGVMGSAYANVLHPGIPHIDSDDESIYDAPTANSRA